MPHIVRHRKNIMENMAGQDRLEGQGLRIIAIGIASFPLWYYNRTMKRKGVTRVWAWKYLRILIHTGDGFSMAIIIGSIYIATIDKE
jgi:hypothetical protein